MRVVLLTLLAGVLWSAPKVGQADFDKLVDHYFDEYYRYHPSQATVDGFHQYDSQLEDYSLAAIASETRSLEQLQAQFEQFPAESLSPESAADRQLVISKIRSQLLELEKIRLWEKNPDKYSSDLASSAFGIMSRNFAPPEARLQSLMAREKQMPNALVQGRRNLRNPPRVYTDVALEQLPGIIGFFKNDVPAAFHDVKDRKLLDEFHASNQAVMDALGEYQKFVKEKLLPHSNGDFRIGAENYSHKLLYDEMVDTPLDQVLEIGYRNLRQNQQAFRDTAAKIDAHSTPQQIMAKLEKDHPPDGALLQSFRDVLGGLREFIVNRKIVTLPSLDPPTVEETPPFMRALSTASLDAPGPYEKVAKNAFFNVTLPEPDWTKEKKEDYLEAFHRGTIVSTAVHEVYPGHYVQFLWMKTAPSKVRKLIGASSNAEGWAHYTEQMMLDEGYGNGDLKLRLGQLQDALLRNARYIVGIEMHTGRMTIDQAVEFFVKEGYQKRAIGEEEAKRGTSDPTYLYYTLGKLEILKLREDYRKLRGSQFSLLEFHDKFLAQGCPPIKIVRRAMLGNDSPVL